MRGVFSEDFRHSEGWSLRKEALLEAVVKQVDAAKLPWLITCNASMCPKDHACVEAPKGTVDMQIQRPKGESIQRTYDYVIHKAV